MPLAVGPVGRTPVLSEPGLLSAAAFDQSRERSGAPRRRRGAAAAWDYPLRRSRVGMLVDMLLGLLLRPRGRLSSPFGIAARLAAMWLTASCLDGLR